MKRSWTLGLFAFVFMGGFVLQLISFTGGPPPGRSGAPNEANCTTGCHNSFAVNSGVGTASILSNVPGEGYMPGETYTLDFSIQEDGISKFGFEASVYSPQEMTTVGELLQTDSINTRLFSGGSRDYVSHTSAGTSGAGSQTWSVDWVAPDPGVGEIEVYAAFNAANGMNGNAGDYIYTEMISISENASTAVEEAWISSLRWYERDGFLHIAMDDIAGGDISWRLRDLRGRLIEEEIAFVHSQNYQARVSLAGIEGGIYLLSIRHKHREYTRKLYLN